MQFSFKHLYWRWIKNQILVFLAMLLFMSMARLGFSLYFGEVGRLFSNPGTLGRAFFLGLRFDAMPLAYINFLPFLLIHIGYFIPGQQTLKILRFIVRSLLFSSYVLLFWIFVCDYGFYSFFQDHLNILFFGFMEDDTIALLVSIWKNYRVPVWLIIIAFIHFGLFKFVSFMFSSFDFDLKAKKFSFWIPVNFIIGLIVLAFLARGNFTRLPLSIEDAHISSDDFINKISLNGVVTFNRAIKIRKTFGEKEFDYTQKYKFKNWRESFEVAFNKKPSQESLLASLSSKSSEQFRAKKTFPHVVLIVMESFGSYWNDMHGKDFNLLGELEKHMDEGIIFNNFLPSENGTIGSIVSVATAQSLRPGARFLSESSFMKVALSSSGHLPYKKSGYDTHFVYGGKLGWRDLGKYLTVQGYDHLWGADEIKEAIPELNNIEEKDLGNEWGIFDEYLYGFIEEQLRYATKPQFFLVLTTSNHPPFEFPSTYNPLPVNLDEQTVDKLTVDAELAKKRFLGLQYANQKVGEFISKLKLTGLSSKSVVAITGDHSYWIAKGVGNEEEFQRYAVPFYIFAPENLRPQTYDKNNFGSHEDIFPTLFHITLPGVEYIKLGENLFEEEGVAINSSGLVANKHGAFHHNKYWKWGKGDKLNLVDSSEDDDLIQLKRIREAFIALTDLYLKEEMNQTKPDVKNGRP